MKVKVQSIKDRGDLKNERLVLKVLGDCDIGMFFVFDTTYTSDGNVSNLVRHPYWFPDKEIRAGDLVVLYSKEGRESEKLNKNGSTSHFFYRGIDRTVWNKEEDCAVIFEIANWDAAGTK